MPQNQFKKGKVDKFMAMLSKNIEGGKFWIGMKGITELFLDLCYFLTLMRKAKWQ